MKKSITVFTPTFNRAYCLHQLYESLSGQTSDDFIWLIIDDGSSDNTKELVEKWIAEDLIEIQYHYKENGGMHTGHNKAYELIDTLLNVCIDSDDWMPLNAIEKILNLWTTLGNSNYAGLIGLDATKNGQIIGTSFPNKLQDCKYSELYVKYNVIGDKKIVYRTDVVKKMVPYPIFEQEKFVPLYYPIIIDNEYNLLCFNEIFCIVDYQEDGSTLNIYNQYFKNPLGFKFSRKIEMINFKSKKLKFKSAIHFVSSKLILKENDFISDSPLKIYTFFAIPFGVIWYFILKRKRDLKRDITKYVK
jgi:glycosyltransferase involved in cell wall biosynthesis